MSTHKNIDKICCVVLIITIVLTLLFMNGKSFGITESSRTKGYEARLFDTSTVHSIDIVMDDWDSFIDTCTNEEYALCSVVIDNEEYKNVAIRAKGNTSLTQVASYGNDRYSFKIEFDHYDSTKNYYGLDKLSLNNIIQDNTYMKDFLCYQMMQKFGVDGPLCSYANITVNGENWGLYLAVESIEEAFLQRNYGNDYGELYKPDSMNMGGGRGNGNKFNMSDWTAALDEELDEESRTKIEETLKKLDEEQLKEILSKLGYADIEELLAALEEADSIDDVLNGVDIEEIFAGDVPEMPEGGERPEMPEGGERPEMQEGGERPEMPDGQERPEMQEGGERPEMPEGKERPEMPEGGERPEMPEGGERPEMPEGQEKPDMQGNGQMQNQGGPNGGMGSNDVKLIYTDDNYDSYSNIFDNAKTDVSDGDKNRLIDSLKKLNSGEDIEQVVNIDEVIRYFVVHNFSCNFDSYTGSMIHNYYLYEEDGQFSMIPWDYNLAFGGFQGGGNATELINYPIDSPVSGGTVDSRPMLAWIFSNDEYTELYHNYFAEFIADYFESGYFSEMIDSLKEMISPYVEKDETKFCTYEEFEKGIDTLKEFCLLRAESITGQLEGTIQSTSDGQAQDSSSLIDGSSINITDMGSMGNRKGGDKDRGNAGNPNQGSQRG